MLVRQLIANFHDTLAPSREFPHEVYNQNGDGYVCLHEFVEAHGILQIALRMNPSEEDPPVLRGDLHNLFVHVIGDSDPRSGGSGPGRSLWDGVVSGVTMCNPKHPKAFTFLHPSFHSA